jgi:hypothetical protein
MPKVAAMIVDLPAQRLAAAQIGALATVRFCQTIEALTGLVAQGRIDAVVADLRDASGASILPTFGELRRHSPNLPLILYFAPTPAALREVPDIIAVGRGLNVVLQNYEHLGLALRLLLRQPRVPSAAETLARHIVPLAPVPFRPFFLVSALKASPRLSVGTAAKWSGTSRRRLERALRRARLPGAAAIVGSCTALHAAWWLDVQGWSTKQVLTQMEFSNPSSLTRVLQRHFGCSVRSLSAEDGFQGLLYRFESRLLGDAAPPIPA